MNWWVSIFLDTCILMRIENLSEYKKWRLVDNINYLLSVLYSWKYTFYISNIIINELYNALENIWLTRYIFELATTEDILNRMSITEQEKLKHSYINNNLSTTWNNLKKEWRKNKEYKKEYQTRVCSVFRDTLRILEDNNPNHICDFNGSNWEVIKNLIISLKEEFQCLDTNDINNYLACKTHDIDYLLTLDSDYDPLQNKSKNVKIINLRKIDQSEFIKLFPIM